MKTAIRLVVVAAISVAGVLSMAGCTSPKTIPPDNGQDWLDRMDSTLGGSGGGSGEFVVDPNDPDNNGSKGQLQGTVYLEEGITGPNDVLAVCRSADTVHLRVQTFTEKKDSTGIVPRLGPTLAEGDIFCGATTTLTIDVPKGTPGIVLEASTSAHFAGALWEAVLKPKGSGA